MRFAYADPPYFGCCGTHYGHEHNEAGDRPFDGYCWDQREAHLALVGWLTAEFDGWALSCNPRDLDWILAACPDGHRIAAWCKTWHQIRPTTVQFAWEPVIFFGGNKDNKRAPMVRDWLSCAVARQRGLRGAKPDQFNQWVIDLLNVQADDEFVDVFPGSGGMAITRAAAPLTFGEPSQESAPSEAGAA